MTDAQMTAFQAGSSAKPAEVNLLFLSLLCAALFLWAAWVCMRSLRAFSTGNLSLKQLGSIVARTVLLLLVSFWLVLS
ncbi:MULTISPECIES: TIGR03758 family integrating conjugative element protein [Citrobacter]|uniref:Conjugal transfer protein n=2 Tax=Enterobacterales TaxID=91347 RepID=A0A0F6TUP6_CITAM|nr:MULTISPECIES: TIGR03758 family integrating conjugative element protein [Citrobacter]AKE58916.1 conjugal transfer protein [Citrobacter amalonaticus Y19]EHK4263080.1 TIGR03758 family integrating conjugative element protein [Escherichia coli]MBU9731853.1 TIGR03758 family integrating conjugative element protein [Klebsiella variicola]MCS1420344.1 TIGR03758 family integrating conjugative element protein [Citrobacter portucalensis]QLX87612.1 TIGR03758 family integrating conjugative element protein